MKYKTNRVPGKAVKKDLKFTVKENTTLMEFLMISFPGKSRNAIKSLLSGSLILVDGKLISQFNHPMKVGQIMTVLAEKVAPERPMVGLKIIHEDELLIIVNKHAGLLTNSSAKERVKTAYAIINSHVKKTNATSRVFIVNKLDRDTSGIIVFAKDEKTQKFLIEEMDKAISEQIYVALVEGEVRKEKDTLTSYMKQSKALIVHSSQNETYGEKAVTNYEVFKRKKGSTLLKINLETKVKNQIRVHLQEMKHPIVGDKKYGAKTNAIGRMALHLKTIQITHPTTKKKITFDTEVPNKF
jgi:23S rRNA pseudouridine1911/1915/1917 synthase